jgi:hypothetical protein
MAARPACLHFYRRRRRQCSAARWRSLLVEQFEPRVLLDGGPNTAPTAQNHILAAVEDTSFRFAATDFPYIDAESHALAAVKIDTLPAAGNLTLFNSSDFTAAPVEVGQFISAADIIAGNFRFQGGPNGSGSPYASFTFQVQDNGGTVVINGVGRVDLDPTPRTQTINVLSVNDPPRGANRQVTILEDTQYHFSASDWGFSDPNDTPPVAGGPPNTLTGIVMDSLPPPQGGALILNHTTFVTVGMFVPVSAISDLVFTPAANAFGSPLATFTFRVKDNGGTAVVFGSDGSAGIGADTDFSSRTMAISVTPVNDAPFSMDMAVTTTEDSTFTFARTDFPFSDVIDAPMPDTFAAVKITTLPASGALMVNGALVAAGTMVPVAMINAGQLKFVPFPSASGPAYASFTFQVQDSGLILNGGSNLDPTPNTVSISVLSVNDSPASKDASVSYIYGSGHGATLNLSSFSFTDLADFPENGLAAVKIVTLPANGLLTDGGNAVVAGQVIAAADFISGLVHYQPTAVGPFVIQDAFTFQVQDDGGIANGASDLDPAPRTMTLLGFASLGEPPVGMPNRTFTLLEDHIYTFSSADFDFTSPPDGNSVQSVTISSLPQPGFLRLAGVPISVGIVIPVVSLQQGQLQFIPNANTNGLSQFGAAVQDTAGPSGFPYPIGFNVLPVNDAPHGINNSVTANEDTIYTFGVGDFGFSDYADSPANNFYTVRIVTPPAVGLLTCGGVPVKSGDIVLAYDIAAGKLKFTPPVNAYGQAYASLSFRLQDDGGTDNGGIDTGFSASALTINVTPVNDPPVGQNTVVVMPENAIWSFYVYSFGFSDAADLPLQNNLRAVEITTLPDKGTLTLGGTAVVAGQFITAADIIAGNLRFTPPPNVFGTPFTSLTFQVQDSGGTLNGGGDLDLTPRTLTINVVQPPCQPPIGSSLFVAGVEDTPYPFRVSDFPASFCSDGLSVIAIQVMSLPAMGTLFDNNQVVHVGDFIPTGDLAAGNFKYLAPPDANGSALSAFTFQVQDDGGTAGGRIDMDPTPRTMTINVLPVNDPPESADTTVATLEDVALGFSAANFGFNDARDNPIPNTFRSLIVTSLPNSGALKIGGTILTNDNLVTVGEIAVGNLSQLMFTPGANTNDGNTASPSFTFKVRDNGGTANGGSDTSFRNYAATIRVTSVNDAPTANDRLVPLLSCDSSYVLSASDFGYSDPYDSPPNHLAAVTITSLPAIGSLTESGLAVQAGQSIPLVDLQTGKLVFSFFNNAVVSDSFSFRVKDDGGTDQGGVDMSVVPNTFSVHRVEPLRPPISIDKTVTAEEDRAYIFTATDFSLYDDDDLNPPDGVTIVSVPSVGVILYNGSPVAAGQFIPYVDVLLGALTFTPPANANGQALASFAFQISQPNDCNVPAPVIGTLTINVQPVNDPPTGFDRIVTVPQNASYVLSPTDFPISDANDHPPNALAGIKILTLPSSGTLTLNGAAVVVGDFVSLANLAAGSFRYNPPGDVVCAPVSGFTFQAQDNGGTANGGLDTDPIPRTISFTLPLVPASHAPAGRDGLVTAVEDTDYVFRQGDFGFSDADQPPNDLRAVKISSLVSVGVLLDNGVAVAAGQFIPVSDIVAGHLKFAPPSNAAGAPLTAFSFQVQDDGGTGACGSADLDPSPKIIAINVLPVNDPPSFSAGQPQNVTDESGPQVVGGWAIGISPGPPNEALQMVHFVIVSNSKTSLFSVQPAIDPAGKLTFTPAANASGTAEIQVVARDDGGTASGGIDTSPPQTLTIQVAKAHTDHNAIVSTDVTGDGFTTPSDALAIVNFINAFGSQRVAGEGEADVLYLDVNADGFIAPSDALAVINSIDSFGSGLGGEPSPEISGQTSAGQPGNSSDLMTLLAVDVSEAAKKRR